MIELTEGLGWRMNGRFGEAKASPDNETASKMFCGAMFGLCWAERPPLSIPFIELGSVPPADR